MNNTVKPCDGSVTANTRTTITWQVELIAYHIVIVLFKYRITYRITYHNYIFTDVYDCPAWKDLMGPLVRRAGRVLLTRMGFLMCIDGFPAFNMKRKGAISLCPGELINLSLPPHLRYDPDNIMIWLLIPNEMSAQSQLKYFEYVTRTELNPLQLRGVDGPDGPVTIKMFASTLDLKGKEKFFNQMTVQSYCGCSHCQVHFDQGPDGPIFALTRRYLPPGHPLRSRRCRFKGQLYEFADSEVRNPPRIKTTQTLFKYVALAERYNVEHYLGQKGQIMMYLYRGIQYHKFNILEWMHNMARAFGNVMDFLVGRDNQFDKRSRETSKRLGVFESIWPGQTVFLSEARTRALQMLDDETIAGESAAWCRRWVRLCGVQLEGNERVAMLRRRVTELRDRALRERIPLPNVSNPLPWRLTSVARAIVNQRILRISYPHYTPVCNIDSDSFINRAGIWRTASKLVAFLVLLVPALRGFVPKLRAGLRSLIWGLRILEGQTISVHEADVLGVERGFKVLKKADVGIARTLIIEGLSMIEGCCPVSCIVPATHCFCHYADGAELHGLLRLLWMINFGAYVYSGR